MLLVISILEMGAIVSSSGSDHIHIHDQPPTSNLNGITESKIRTIQDGGNRLYSHDRENRMILPPSLPHSPVISSYSLLLALPRELLNLVYSFLDWSSYGHLDLAMTSHLLRPHYLATLNGMITPLRFLYSHPYSNLHHSHLRWIISRNVLPLHITILRDADLYLFLALILRVRSRLIALYIYGTSSFPQEYLFSIGSCPCLTKFELYLPSNSISPQQLGQFLQQNPQIQKLKFHVAAPYPPNIVSIIRDNCPNLKYLYLPKNKVWLNDHCISELVRGPKIPNLQALSLSCCRLSEQSIQLMMDSFPNLHYFTFDRVLNSEEGMMLSCLQRIVHKALIDDNVETRMLGMRCLVTYSSRSKKRGGNDVTLEELELQLSCTNVVYDATLFLLGKVFHSSKLELISNRSMIKYLVFSSIMGLMLGCSLNSCEHLSWTEQ